MALVDEADSILIDEARVPLILSRTCKNTAQNEYHRHALRLAAQLSAPHDYRLDRARMTAALTDHGAAALEKASRDLGSVWRNGLHREETVCRALCALHLYLRDRHYLVSEGKVSIIDAATGRVAMGRVWSRGLHQLIELKEGCEPSGEQVTEAQITFQRFFRRYFHLAGMSGTLAEAGAELRQIYQLEVVKVPMRRASRRRRLPTRLYFRREDWFEAVIERVREMVRAGRPVLIGTDSVLDSEEFSTRLNQVGIEHEVLNARQDAHEADIVARAGEAGRVTVSTNIAGRGTDIPLAPGVAQRGGLHVLSCQRNASRRIDRQLFGRCARQGDPGSAEIVLCIERRPIGRLLSWLPRRLREGNCLSRPTWLVELAVALPQGFEQRNQRAVRWALFTHDEQLTAAGSVVAGKE
jgi:preprotein translocase subunit SecA